jgi:chloramphenicol 3-O phosphotransferase
MGEPGTIIILNGTSSAGKSSLARALLAHLLAPAVQRGIDYWVARTPWGFLQLLPAEAPVGVVGMALLYGQDSIVGVRLGVEGRRWLAGMYEAAATLAAAGVHVVMDDVLFDAGVLRCAVSILAPQRPLFVGVRCALPVAEAREWARGDRPVGLARTFAPLVHAHGGYDLEIDSAAASPSEGAAQIAAFLASGQPRTAFARLAAHYSIDDPRG